MQLMTFNSLLMFDVVFVFFLFLVGVTCLVYYLPPATRKSRRAHKSTTGHHSSEQSDIECGFHQGSPNEGALNEEEAQQELEDSVQYYRQLAQRHHQCPHHSHHHHAAQDDDQAYNYYDQQLHHHSFMNNRYMPVAMTSSPGSSSGSSQGLSRSSAAAYVPIPSTPPPSLQNHNGSAAVEDEEEETGNMEILPPLDQQKYHPATKSSRHLYHNILNSAFEQHGNPYGDMDEYDDEFNMIATNVEILSALPPPPSIHGSNSHSSISTSLPASPGHNQQSSPRGLLREESGTVINMDNNRGHNNIHQSNSNGPGQTTTARRPEQWQSAPRHVVGICQYHMQQHLKSHHEQHQLHRLYQQQQLLQQFSNQPLQSVSSPTTPSGATSSSTLTPSIIQNPGSVEENVESVGEKPKKVQYIVVDTSTDRNKNKPRPNKYCHVKAQNCDMNRKCAAASGPVDEV